VGVFTCTGVEVFVAVGEGGVLEGVRVDVTVAVKVLVGGTGVFVNMLVGSAVIVGVAVFVNVLVAATVFVGV
jgi:hypothetical protein